MDEDEYSSSEEDEIGWEGEESSSDEPAVTSPRTLYSCQYCSATFRKHAKLARHLLTHTKERPYHCTFPGCEKCFGRKDHLTRHMLSHNAEFLFDCPYEGCQKKFKSEYNLNRHIKKHVQKESQPPQSYKCSYCDLTFTKKQQLRKHEFLHTGIKPYPCSFPGCFQAFFSQARLTIHEKTHKEGSECVCSVTGCNFSTSNVDEFKKHLEMVHRIVKRSETTANPRILCTVPGCGHTFISKQSLANHIAVYHHHRKYKCEVCGKEYAQPSSLSRHRVVHRAEEQEQKRKRMLAALTGRKRAEPTQSISVPDKVLKKEEALQKDTVNASKEEVETGTTRTCQFRWFQGFRNVVF
ncbi:hypothetical protein WA577_004365 [Blastocystis sp. JDR]